MRRVVLFVLRFERSDSDFPSLTRNGLKSPHRVSAGVSAVGARKWGDQLAKLLAESKAFQVLLKSFLFVRRFLAFDPQGANCKHLVPISCFRHIVG